MSRLYLVFIFIIISCGGGESSSSIDTPITNGSNNAPSGLLEDCSQQQTNLIRCDFTHQGLNRYYMLQPPHPEAEGDSSLILNLHGYGSSAMEQMLYTGLNSLTYSQENNFILIHPQGAPLETVLTSSSSHWNSGGWTIGSTVDDVDFIDSVIELVSKKYNLNMDRIYSTGMSNGGFMSYHLACNLSSKIAGVASVTGSMSRQTYDSCNPQKPIPILQIHGALDGTVPFDGNSALGMEPIEKVMTYWQEFNSCDVEPVTNTNDFEDLGSSVEHSQYVNCSNNLQVELYKIDSMSHVWPRKDRFGVSASEVIFNFFNTYDANGKLN